MAKPEGKVLTKHGNIIKESLRHHKNEMDSKIVENDLKCVKMGIYNLCRERSDIASSHRSLPQNVGEPNSVAEQLKWEKNRD